jgi:uncharacterized protein YndB with AHSA1/START domain
LSNEHATNKMTTKIEGRELVLERTFDAPRKLVFQAFSEAEHLKHWWGPKGWSLPVCNIDFRPGGVWHFCMKCTDESQEYYGQESWGKAVYKEIIAPERIVYVDSFSDAEGNTVADMPETLITMTFIEQEGKTTIISRAEYASAEAVKTVLDMGMIQGITETYDNLERHLNDIQK